MTLNYGHIALRWLKPFNKFPKNTKQIYVFFCVGLIYFCSKNCRGCNPLQKERSYITVPLVHTRLWKAWVLQTEESETGYRALKVVRNQERKYLKGITERRIKSLKDESKIPYNLMLQAGQKLHWFQAKQIAADWRVLSRYFSSFPLRGLLSSNFKPCQDRQCGKHFKLSWKLEKGHIQGLRYLP